MNWYGPTGDCGCCADLCAAGFTATVKNLVNEPTCTDDCGGTVELSNIVGSYVISLADKGSSEFLVYRGGLGNFAFNIGFAPFSCIDVDFIIVSTKNCSASEPGCLATASVRVYAIPSTDDWDDETNRRLLFQTGVNNLCPGDDETNESVGLNYFSDPACTTMTAGAAADFQFAANA